MHAARRRGQRGAAVVDFVLVMVVLVPLFLGILRDGLVLEGVNADYLDFILGIAILAAMCINIYVGRVRKGSGVG